MRAIRVHQFGDPSVLKLEEIPAPEPGPGQIQIRVHAAGVNPVETYVRAGRYAMLPSLPYIPGSDGAGTVTALGPGVTEWTLGDRVFFFGTAAGRAQGAYAEFAVCPADRVGRLPPSTSYTQGAALGVPFATAHRALFGRAKAQPGEIVFVHGASGGVGTAALQLARWKGCKVIGTAGSAEGLELIRANGAQFAVSHRDALYLDQVRSATQDRGPDVILEMLANVNLDQDLALIAPRGRVVVIGNRGRIEIDPRQTMSKDSSILGMSLWNATEEELKAIYTDIVQGLAEGLLVPVIGTELPLADAAKAHDQILAPGAHGKIVLVS